jgi:urease gamma subunit
MNILKLLTDGLKIGNKVLDNPAAQLLIPGAAQIDAAKNAILSGIQTKDPEQVEIIAAGILGQALHGQDAAALAKLKPVFLSAFQAIAVAYAGDRDFYEAEIRVTPAEPPAPTAGAQKA